MLTPQQAARLKPVLDALLQDCDALARRAHDPVEFVWAYENPRDQEFVALLTSSLAYGRVALLKEAVARVLAVLGSSPSRAIDTFGIDEIAGRLDGFVYRMSRAEDVIDLIAAISRVQREFGSLEAAYLAGGAASPDATHTDLASALVKRLRAGRRRAKLTRGFAYLLPDPADGSTCKRLHLFFRWMGRGPDAIDLGLWRAIRPGDLIMPLDTHTSRMCRYLGMSERKSTDHKTALEVTESLALLDPHDPLKYDFALCHLGISGRCIHKYSDEHCPSCPIVSMCVLARDGRRH